MILHVRKLLNVKKLGIKKQNFIIEKKQIMVL